MSHGLRAQVGGHHDCRPGRAVQMRCLECGRESAIARVCARCGAPGAHQRFVAADLAARAARSAAGWAAAAAISAGVDNSPRNLREIRKLTAPCSPSGSRRRNSRLSVCGAGYDIDEVDAFLDAIRETFLGIREPSLTPDEIRNKQFSTTRLRPGYDEEEVDAFLDEAE